MTKGGGRPERLTDPDQLAERILAQVGRHIVLGLPLGLGKANHVANALYERAQADSSIRLDIFTALTLEPPVGRSELERRFLAPLAERLYAGWPRLAYAEALRAGTLPDNVTVGEFFFVAGRWLGVEQAQRSYISANYTHAGRALLERGVNVVGQLVAPDPAGSERYSLSCNTDLTLDLMAPLAARKQAGEPVLFVGQVNSELPFMPGEAARPASDFDLLLEGCDFPLFSAVKTPVSDADTAAGIHAARLVPDGGTIQIGIGSLGDALAHALILRHRRPDAFAAIVRALDPDGEPPRTSSAPLCAAQHPGETGPFEEGLYAASEMFVDGLLELYQAGVLKRPAGDGAVLHAGFFVGPTSFYERLRAMPESERARFQMRAISFVNELYGEDEAEKRADRRKARFVNNAMMATLLGAIVSDALEDGRVVSGVGGQYNFVAQAFALDDARSVIALNATNRLAGRRRSNIVWSYGHVTIPRHLRDIVVTEHGIADLRGRSDRDCIAAMLGIADAEFQDGLMEQAKGSGKIEKGYAIPAARRDNSPERIGSALAPFKAEGLLPPFPFGTELTGVEQRLLPALGRLKRAAKQRRQMARLAWQGLGGGSDEERQALSRMGLAEPRTARERLYRLLVAGALRQS
jgi:acyl-CoA hydrolase